MLWFGGTGLETALSAGPWATWPAAAWGKGALLGVLGADAGEAAFDPMNDTGVLQPEWGWEPIWETEPGFITGAGEAEADGGLDPPGWLLPATKKKFSLQKDFFCFVMTMRKREQILILRSDAQTLSYWDRIRTLFQKQISKTFPRLELIFPGLQISPYTLSFPRFKNRFSLQSTNISYNANSENFISWVKQISRTFLGP